MILYLYITRPDDYLRGEIRYHASDEELSIEGWFLAGTVDFDTTNVDFGELTETAVDCIDKAEQKEIAEHEVKMGMLKEKKQNLLSITHQTR